MSFNEYIDSLPNKDNPLVGLDDKEAYLLLITCAYFKYISLSKNVKVSDLLENLNHWIPNDICVLTCQKLLENKTKHTLKRKIQCLLDAFTDKPEKLRNFILSQEVEYKWLGTEFSKFTPMSIIKLAMHILKPEENDVLADFCTGTGSVLCNDYKACKVYAYDTDMWAIQISAIRSSLFNNKVILEKRNISDLNDYDVVDYGDWKSYGIDLKTAMENGLDIDQEVPIFGDTSLYYDKIFCHYPISSTTEIKSFASSNLDEWGITGGYNGGKMRTRDWYYNYYVRSLLKENGIAVCLTTAGELFNTNTYGARKVAIDSKQISTVIALPNIYPNMPQNLRMLVFSNKNNDYIRMVDASSFVSNYVTATAIRDVLDFEQIYKCLDNDVKHFSKLVPYNELCESNYSLEPEHFVNDKLKIENGVSLEDLCISITRGTNLSKEQLKRLYVDGDSNNKYLTLSDIEDGVMRDKLKNLSKITKELERYCVEPNDIVVSKTGPKFKVWWRDKYPIEQTTKILASSNLYILKFSNSILDPEYIAIYLRSSEGQIQLKRSCTGSVIKNIPINSLKRVRIPFVDSDAQEAFIQKYHEILSVIKHHKGAIEYQQNMLKDLLY